MTQNVDSFEGGRSTVRSKKTEHHEGKASREVPIFPELRPFLEEAWEQAEVGQEYVITRYRGNVNLRTQLQKIIKRAGVAPWPKLWQNLRATRATELVKECPVHVATAFLGHSEATALKHYWQVTDEDFKKATQNTTQQAHARGRTGSQVPTGRGQQAPAQPGDASSCRLLQNQPVAREGFELVQQSSGKPAITTERDAEYDARCAELVAVDADLQQLITLWPQLAASVREALLQQASQSLTRGP